MIGDVFGREHRGNNKYFAGFADECSPCVGRNKLVGSVCPQLCGFATTKLLVLLLLAGGVAREGGEGEGGGARVRGDVHALLVGDPGTGAPTLASRITLSL